MFPFNYIIYSFAGDVKQNDREKKAPLRGFPNLRRFIGWGTWGTSQAKGLT
jgi:hypothetical protein